MTSSFMDFAYAAHALTELILGALKLRGRYAHEAPGSRSGKSKMYVRHHAMSLLAHALLGALVLHAGLVDTRVGQGASLVLATFHGGAVGAAFTAFAGGELPVWKVFVPHSPFAPLLESSDGVQISAQYLSPVGVCNAQVGFAVSPEGTSVGHAPLVHFGEQKSPLTPCTCTAFSSLSQPSAGSP